MVKGADSPDSIDLLLTQYLIESDFGTSSQINMHHTALTRGQKEALPTFVPMIHLHALHPRIVAVVSAKAQFVLVNLILIICCKYFFKHLLIGIKGTDRSIIGCSQKRCTRGIPCH